MPYKNKEEAKTKSAEYYKKNKQAKTEYNAEYRKKNKQKIAEIRAKHRKKNKQKIAEYKTRYDSNRRKKDPMFVLIGRVRNRINYSIKNKSNSSQKLIGCTWEFLHNYLESKFLPGMSWENRSKWHIDHIRPLCSFDLTDPVQQKEACHYTNLQPLWATDNLRKGRKCLT
jgi:hypothetical protein